MNELSYWNGNIGAGKELSISVLDAGFVQGVTVSEQLRTFGGRLFEAEKHFARLRRSLEIVGIEDVDLDHLKQEALVVASHNHSLLQPGDDLGLTVFVTPGPPACSTCSYALENSVGMFTTPLPFHRWADKYSAGESLVISTIRQIPASCWPSELKCRSRMHYFLADREAEKIAPGSRALLLDLDGFVAEASSASVILYRASEGLVAPPPEKVLPSISVDVLKNIAGDIGTQFIHRDMSVGDLQTADEVFLSSTSPCLLSVTAIDGQRIGTGKPGTVFQELIDAWSQSVETDIVSQATTFAERE